MTVYVNYYVTNKFSSKSDILPCRKSLTNTFSYDVGKTLHTAQWLPTLSYQTLLLRNIFQRTSSNVRFLKGKLPVLIKGHIFAHAGQSKCKSFAEHQKLVGHSFTWISRIVLGREICITSSQYHSMSKIHTFLQPQIQHCRVCSVSLKHFLVIKVKFPNYSMNPKYNKCLYNLRKLHH